MLNNTFFTFANLKADGAMLTADITLNPAHEIFKGHFPEQPIVPGVCVVQMIKEVLEAHLQHATKLTHADNIKFLSFIDPNQTPTVGLELKINDTGEQVKVDAQLLNAETKFLKLKGAFVKS